MGRDCEWEWKGDWEGDDGRAWGQGQGGRGGGRAAITSCCQNRLFAPAKIMLESSVAVGRVHWDAVFSPAA